MISLKLTPEMSVYFLFYIRIYCYPVPWPDDFELNCHPREGGDPLYLNKWIYHKGTSDGRPSSRERH